MNGVASKEALPVFASTELDDYLRAAAARGDFESLLGVIRKLQRQVRYRPIPARFKLCMKGS